MLVRAAVTCLLLGVFGCASKTPAPAVPSSESLYAAQIRESAAELEASAARSCEQICVASIIDQCVLLAVQQYEYVSDSCISDKSRACLLSCTP